ncbi:MAG: C-terminal target protein [Bacteroidetes bacterium]|jgi:V8-like Glu-specific endopeptidase|nr:C-terminal target protein [Bacteroidota bacterium]
MKHKIIIVVIFILGQMHLLNAQYNSGGLPYTFRINSTIPSLPNYRTVGTSLNNFATSALNSTALRTQADSLAVACSTCTSKLYGKEMKQTIDIIANGTYEVIDSVKVWRYVIESTTAEAIQLYFSKFNLPLTGELFLYSEDRTNLTGAFTWENNPDSSFTGPIKFGIAPFKGNKVVLEYNQRVSDPGIPQLEIHSIIHVFNDSPLVSKTSGVTGACEINIKCPEGYGWDNEKKSVVLILYHSGTYGLFGVGTGNLMNTTSNSEGPYVLTAGHVIKNSNNQYKAEYDPSTIFFLFNYETSICNTQQGVTQMNMIQSVYGSSDMASKYDISDFDYALLKMNTSKETLRKFGVCYAGWNKSSSLTILQKPYTMIHHPDALEKSISVSLNQDLESIQYVTDPFPNSSMGFYRTKWAVGAQEPGSSGAPIFDYYHRVIGSLNGGPGDCVGGTYNNDWVRISKFSKAWTDGGLGFWLDPINSGASTVNAFCPPPSTTPDPNSANNDGCRTVNFTINNQATNKLINVCKSDIWLYPSSGSCGSGSEWNFKASEQNRWCGQIAHQWASTRTDLKAFGTWCHCYFLQLFISVQECDRYLNTIGPEYSDWYFIYDGDLTVEQERGNFKAFNVNGYFVPQGYQLQDGKYYRIKVATHQYDKYPSWYEHSGYVKTIAGNLTVQNESPINHNQLAQNDLTIINSTVPFTYTTFKATAENKVSIQANSQLQAGRYFISDENCSSINNYNARKISGIDSSKVKKLDNGVMVIKQSDLFPKKDVGKNYFESSIFPNPTNGNTTLVLESSDIMQSLKICITNVVGNIVNEYTVETGGQKRYETEIQMNDLKRGIYFITVSGDKQKPVTKKVVLQ